MLAFPPLLLLLAMVAVLQPNVRNVTIGLAVLVIPTYIRLVRANTIRFAQREFVTAAKAIGASNRRIILRELLPNVLLPVLSYGFLIIAVLIVAEASLSFLGLSIQRPNPTWGNLIAAGQNDFDHNPHLVFAPGLVLFITVFALNQVGDQLRRWWEPSDR
jgi:peptide/nickel transport system permease protein